MKTKEAYRRVVQTKLGWVYPHLKWLTEKEVELANSKRDRLLKSLSKKARYSFRGSKIHIGKLSPGCLICGQGPWSCLFINALCTANCFYCPEDRSITQEKDPFDEIKFETPRDYVDYVKILGIKGVGFSGGEPLLVFDKLLLYIHMLRKEFGKKIYLWIYTNGDLVDKDKMKKLKEAGLDEVRFNISASNYNLQPVESAINVIDAISIEIPMIPEDYKIVQKSLSKMQKIGVNYLNIHQLCTTEWNYKNYIDRGYTFIHRPNVPVLESEITALKLMKYALDKEISLPINYCSCVYKERFQEKGSAGLKARLVKRDFEELTSLNYIRRLSVHGSTREIKNIIKTFRDNGRKDNLWFLNASEEELFIHSSLLKYINFYKHALSINYFRPIFGTALSSNGLSSEIKLNRSRQIYIKKILLALKKLSHPVSIKSFQKFFIENMSEKETLNYFYENYNFKTKEELNEMKKELETLMSLKAWEQLETGFPAIY